MLVWHEDLTTSIIETKYSFNNSPGERVMKQAQGIGQLMLYGEMFREINDVTPRLFLSDEKIESLTIKLMCNLNIGFIGLKKDRIFVINPYK